MKNEVVMCRSEFQCGRCGDVFKTTPVINPPWPEEDHETSKTVSLSSSLKKERNGRKTEIERSGVGELILTCVCDLSDVHTNS